MTVHIFRRFSWLKDEEIGKLSHEWNWLVGWYKEPDDGKPKAIHYTEGGPGLKIIGIVSMEIFGKIILQK